MFLVMVMTKNTFIKLRSFFDTDGDDDNIGDNDAADNDISDNDGDDDDICDNNAIHDDIYW